MYRERMIRPIAGTMIILMTLLGLFVDKYWHLITIWIGILLIQSPFTGICPPEWILKKLGIKSCEEECEEELFRIIK